MALGFFFLGSLSDGWDGKFLSGNESQCSSGDSTEITSESLGWIERSNDWRAYECR
jgi:hypothetical protein